MIVESKQYLIVLEQRCIWLRKKEGIYSLLDVFEGFW